MHTIHLAPVVLTLLSASLVAQATPAKLAPGAAAPPLSIAKWVKGDPVASFAAGKVYVVEFWATWCGPCIASMPHLSQLQAQHRDEGLTVIGVTSEDPGNSLAQVEAMVAEKGDTMGYTVAWDDGRKTSDAYMRAAGQGGIPTSFVVDQKGRIAWIGHPMMLDIVLGGVFAGDWDPATGDERVDAVMRRFGEIQAALAQDTPEAAAKVQQFVEEFPFFAEQVEEMRFKVLFEAKKYDRAYGIASKIVDRAIAAKDASKLNGIAWPIVDPAADVAQRDLDLAQKAAEKAVEFSKQKDGNILDTLARVHFWRHDYKKALELQQKAAKLTKNPDVQKALAEYEKLAAGEEPKKQ